jgi:RNA polymerase sigma-70 factor (ECF subfamily)
LVPDPGFVFLIKPVMLAGKGVVGNLSKPDKPAGGIADPDETLVRKIANGDPKAAEQLVHRHIAVMTAVARNMLGDAAEAEDVAQEVFLKVWTHAGKWQPGKAKFQTWMHRVAINLCYDRLRKRREVYLDALPEQVDEQSLAADDSLIENERAGKVEAAIQTLAPRQCAAITLCHLREMGNIEAAKVMEISVEALESLLARGRRGLRLALSDEIKELLGDKMS